MLQSNIFRDVFQQALYALSDNKLRTFLSILGIAIGIGAVMTVGTVSQGIKQYIFAELETYGLKSIWIYRDWGENSPDRIVRRGSGIDNEDYKLLSSGCCEAILRTTPVVYANEGAIDIRNGSAYYKASIEGVGTEYIGINNDKLIAGRNFRRDDMKRRKAVAIVGTKVTNVLFGNKTSALGKSFRFRKQKYTIVGLLENKNRDLLSKIGADDYDINGRVLIPYTTYQNIMGLKEIHTLQAEAKTLAQTQQALSQVIGLLERRHGYRYTYTSESMEGWIETANGVLASISLIGLVGASISLLVGGMGIMNIMSTSVVERTREIGIRKAIGANNKDVLMQFLMEATVVSTIGGLIGLILGIIVAYAIGLVSGYPLGPSWVTAVIALLVSMVVGILSGYYPAHRAAQLRPVDALRHE